MSTPKVNAPVAEVTDADAAIAAIETIVKGHDFMKGAFCILPNTVAKLEPTRVRADGGFKNHESIKRLSIRETATPMGWEIGKIIDFTGVKFDSVLDEHWRVIANLINSKVMELIEAAAPKRAAAASSGLAARRLTIAAALAAD